MTIAAWVLLFCSALLVYLFLSILLYKPKDKDRPEAEDALQSLVNEINTSTDKTEKKKPYDPQIYENREEKIRSSINACWPELLPELSFVRKDDLLTVSWLSANADAISFYFRDSQHMQIFANSIAQKKNITIEPFRVMLPLRQAAPDPDDFQIGEEEGLEKYKNFYDAWIHIGYGARCPVKGDASFLKHVSFKPVLSFAVINIMEQSMALPKMIQREIHFQSLFPDKLCRDYFYFLPEARDVLTPSIQGGYLYAIDEECLAKAKKQLQKQAGKQKMNISFGNTESAVTDRKLYNRTAKAIRGSMHVRCILPKTDLDTNRIGFAPFADHECVSRSAAILFYQNLLKADQS